MEHIRYKEAFLLLDQNRSGVIQPSDVHFLIRALGFTPTEADLKRIDAEFLQGKQIDYLSFIDLMSKISCRKFSSEQIKDAFLTFDKNRYGNMKNNRSIDGNRSVLGLIHLEKFRTVMMSNGEPLTEDEMNEMLKDFPIDDDG